MKRKILILLGLICLVSCAGPEPNFNPEKTPVDLTPSGSIGGYDYVDLGLSVKWATYNIGAKSIDEIGEYYAWGETTPYVQDITWLGYGWDYKPCSPDCILSSIFDAATVNWSEDWRLPTSKEQEELIKGCKWVWVDNFNDSSVSGYIGTSLKNGKSIFLPATQFISNSYSEIPAETDAIYWSSSVASVAGSLKFGAGTGAECMTFNINGSIYPIMIDEWKMGCGATIRPVVGTPNNYFPDPSTITIDEAETARQGFTVNGEIGGYTYVDLGLPSRTVWATYNVGASLPTEYGDYFAWGETSSKDLYVFDTYKFFHGYKDASKAYPQLSKYVWHRNYGNVDGKYFLEKEDDAASVNWGDEWSIPTPEQLNELNTYCDVWRQDIVVNGKKIIGCVAKSYINGNKIYFPAAGWEYNNVPNNHMWVWYWTSEISKRMSSWAIFFMFDEDESRLVANDGEGREDGMPIRAVAKIR